MQRVTTVVTRALVGQFTVGDEAAATRTTLDFPRPGRDLAKLTRHRPPESPLHYAASRIAGLILPWQTSGEISEDLIRGSERDRVKAYVRASLGMPHEADLIDNEVAPYLDELSKSASKRPVRPVTSSSFTLLYILYAASRIPGTAEFVRLHEFSLPKIRTDFVSWLQAYVAPAAIRADLFPDDYFSLVRYEAMGQQYAASFAREAGPKIIVPTMRSNRSGLDYSIDADLDGACLKGVDLSSCVLLWPRLRDADLSHAGLGFVEMEKADLSRANLTEAKLSCAKLVEAQMQGATLVRAELKSADLGCANLKGARLSDAQACRVKLRGAMLENADLAGADLADADLREACLRGASLRGANLNGANLRGVDLLTADLADATLAGAFLDGATLLLSPEMCARLIRRVGLPIPSLDGTTLLTDTDQACSHLGALIDTQGDFDSVQERFDQAFNHRNRGLSADHVPRQDVGRSVLLNITALHIGCKELKHAMVRTVVNILDKSRRMHDTVLDPFVPSLADVLFDDPSYLAENPAFSNWLLDALLGDGSELMFEGLPDAALKNMVSHALTLLGTGGEQIATGKSVAIYQLLYAMRERTHGSDADSLVWKTLVERLHRQYLYVLQECIPSLVGQGSIYENEKLILGEDGEDCEAFPLVSSDGSYGAIFTDAQFRQLVLEKEPQAGQPGCYWSNVRCVSRGLDRAFEQQPQSLDAALELDRLQRGRSDVLNAFPLLRAASSRAAHASVAMDKMLDLVGLAGPLRHQFDEALKRQRVTEKMISHKDHLALEKVFGDFLEGSEENGVRLKPAHFVQMQGLWENDTPKEFALRVFCMAALYTKCSSSAVFGTEMDSPAMLRVYAVALLRSTHELDRELLPRETLNVWLDKLQSQRRAFPCTALLYDTMLKRLNDVLDQQKHDVQLHAVRDEMIPLAWRR